MSFMFPVGIIEETLNVLADDGISVRIYENYSGRGMRGETCFGVVFTSSDVAKFGAALMVGTVIAFENCVAFDDTDPGELRGEMYDSMQFLNAGRTDSLGFDTILYFPGWEIDGDLPGWAKKGS